MPSRRRADHAAPRQPSGRSRWWPLTGLAFAGAGLLAVTSAQASGGDELRAGSVTDLASVVRQQRAETSAQQARVIALNGEVTRLSKRGGGAVGKRLQRRITALSPQAGLTSLRGAGVTVTLDDAPRASIAAAVQARDPNAEMMVIHQQNIESVVNALWAGGATGISVMDQRVITTTAVKCVGNSVIVNGAQYAPPYVIRAVGDPLQLQASLSDDPYVSAFRLTADAFALGYVVDSSTQVSVPAYASVVKLHSARVLADDGATR